MISSKFDGLNPGAAIQSTKTAFYGGNARVKRAGPSAVTIAFPAPASPELAVLANALDLSAVQYSVGSSLLGRAAEATGTRITVGNDVHSDAALLHITIAGADANAVRQGAVEAVKAVRAVASGSDAEAAKKAVARTKFAELEARDKCAVLAATVKTTDVSGVTESALKDAATALIKGKVAVAAVGQVANLPYAEDLF
jgi:ubiquinol-cytochrome c reductase core subunit 2